MDLIKVIRKNNDNSWSKYKGQKSLKAFKNESFVFHIFQ